MLKFKDIVRYICVAVIYLYKYIKNLLKMDSVYDCARPFMLVAGIFGIGGNTMCEIDGVRSVRNTRFSLIIAALITLIITPYYCILSFRDLFCGEQRSLSHNTSIILFVGRYFFILSTAAVTCSRTHIYCKDLTKVLQILNNTDMMLKRENIHVNYWKIILTTIFFGLIACNYGDLYLSAETVLLYDIPFFIGYYLVRLLMDIACEIYFTWIILFLLIIRERFVGVNKLLLQDAQLPSIMQDDSLLRRISLARDIHEQLSEAVELFSDISRFLIIGLLVPGMLQSLFYAVFAAVTWNEYESESMGKIDNVLFVQVLKFSHFIVVPIIKIVTLTAVCEGHKNNRQVLTARLRYLIAREEDPAIVHQLQQYIWYIYDTPAGLVDVRLVDVDFTLLFMVIDMLVQYLFVIYSYVRISVQGETM